MSTKLLSSLALSRKLGSGHFGEVYEGQDPVLGRVAVKVLRKISEETEEEWLSRKSELLQEGKHLKDAEHDKVVRVFQVLESQAEDAIHMVMEYCENGSLQERFELNPMRLSELRNILTDAALGLQAVHSRGMVHRDIKPANLLLDENRRAKLADFGLVTNNILLGYASLAGYTDHLAKEVFDDGITSVKTDVWAFGMTAYRLLHGLNFYSELPAPRSLITCGGFATKLPWLPHVPERWRRFVRKAMHDDPSSRIQSAGEILRFLGTLPVEPDWNCDYSEQHVKWGRVRKGRKIEVIWSKYSSRKHEWEAYSLPLYKGRKYKLKGSDGYIGKAEVIKQLNHFFQQKP